MNVRTRRLLTWNAILKLIEHRKKVYERTDSMGGVNISPFAAAKEKFHVAVVTLATRDALNKPDIPKSAIKPVVGYMRQYAREESKKGYGKPVDKDQLLRIIEKVKDSLKEKFDGFISAYMSNIKFVEDEMRKKKPRM